MRQNTLPGFTSGPFASPATRESVQATQHFAIRSHGAPELHPIHPWFRQVQDEFRAWPALPATEKVQNWVKKAHVWFR